MGEFSSFDPAFSDGGNPGTSNENIERLSNFPIIFRPIDDVKYIEEVESFLKDDKEDLMRFIHGILLSGGHGWDIQDLKEEIKESYGFVELHEVDNHVDKCFGVRSFHEFIGSDWMEGVVRLEGETGHVFPFLDESNKDIYEDARKSKHKEEKERKKDQQSARRMGERERNGERRTIQRENGDERMLQQRNGETGQRRTTQTDPRALSNAVRTSSSESEPNEFDDSPDEAAYSDEDEGARKKGRKMKGNERKKKAEKEKTQVALPSATLQSQQNVDAISSNSSGDELNEFDDSPDEVWYSDDDDEETNAKRAKASEKKKKRKGKAKSDRAGMNVPSLVPSQTQSSQTATAPRTFQPTSNKWEEDVPSIGESVPHNQPQQQVAVPQQPAPQPQLPSYPQQQPQMVQQGQQMQHEYVGQPQQSAQQMQPQFAYPDQWQQPVHQPQQAYAYPPQQQQQQYMQQGQQGYWTPMSTPAPSHSQQSFGGMPSHPQNYAHVPQHNKMHQQQPLYDPSYNSQFHPSVQAPSHQGYAGQPQYDQGTAFPRGDPRHGAYSSDGRDMNVHHNSRPGSSPPSNKTRDVNSWKAELKHINTARKRIRWQIICTLKNVRDKNDANKRRRGNAKFEIVEESSLYELIESTCGDEMELFTAIMERGGDSPNHFRQFLRDMERDGLLFLYFERRKGQYINTTEEIVYVIDPYTEPPSHLKKY